MLTLGAFEQFPYTNFHDLNLDWILQTTKNMLAQFIAYEASVDAKLILQNSKIVLYKTELEQIVADYKHALETEMGGQRAIFESFYTRALDVYNKTVEQVLVMEGYVDNAISDFGSIAQWSISDSGELIATVFNTGILISIGMTSDGRLEVTTDE